MHLLVLVINKLENFALWVSSSLCFQTFNWFQILFPNDLDFKIQHLTHLRVRSVNLLSLDDVKCPFFLALFGRLFEGSFSIDKPRILWLPSVQCVNTQINEATCIYIYIHIHRNAFMFLLSFSISTHSAKKNVVVQRAQPLSLIGPNGIQILQNFPRGQCYLGVCPSRQKAI